MSWTIGMPVEVGGDSVEGDLESVTAQGQEGPHVEQALHAAKQAAIDLVRSGALGHPGRSFKVMLSGHANPDHAPTEGWANDCIGVSIYQV